MTPSPDGANEEISFETDGTDFGIYSYDMFNRVKTYTNGVNMVMEQTGTDMSRYYRGATGIEYADRNGTFSYYQKDAHGDVTALTDGSGTITKTYRYDAFGTELEPQDGDMNPFRYCGEYFDSETNFIYLRARYYDPSVGRFISEDPARADGTNWYTYCMNNPIRFKDPSGLAVTDEDRKALEQGLITQNDVDTLNNITYEYNKAETEKNYTKMAAIRKQAVKIRKKYNPNYYDDFDYTFGTGYSAIDSGEPGKYMISSTGYDTSDSNIATSTIFYTRDAKRYLKLDKTTVNVVLIEKGYTFVHAEGLYGNHIERVNFDTKNQNFTYYYNGPKVADIGEYTIMTNSTMFSFKRTNSQQYNFFRVVCSYSEQFYVNSSGQYEQSVHGIDISQFFTNSGH